MRTFVSAFTLAVATSLTAALVAPAAAVPPTERSITDPVEPGRAYDIVSVTLQAAPAPDRKAQVTVVHDRRVQVGDNVDVWIDTDDDRVPDLFITGLSYSEYAVYKARGWESHHRDITDLGCATMRMQWKRTVIRFDPGCLAPSKRFSVSVRSYIEEQPSRTDDYVPGRHRLTKKVLSYVAS